MKTGYVTGAFNISSNMRVEIEPGVHLLGSKDGADWPLLVVDEIWPGFGFARDADPVQGRLMHQVRKLRSQIIWGALSCMSDFGGRCIQSLIFTFGTTNVSVGGGGTIDCRGDGFQVVAASFSSLMHVFPHLSFDACLPNCVSGLWQRFGQGTLQWFRSAAMRLLLERQRRGV